MPGGYKRKKYHVGDTHLKKRWRVRNRKKDLDEIDVDLKEENAEKLLNQQVDLDLPGAAQHYCLHCARYFIDEHSLKEHFKTKVHKRRLKALELEPYSIEESERAAGHGSFKLPNKRKIVTQNTDVNDITDKDSEADVSSSKKQKSLKMLLKFIPCKILAGLSAIKIQPKRSSTLFMNGPKATDNFVYVTPHVDYSEYLSRKNVLQEELLKRQAKNNLIQLENLWGVYEELNNKKTELTNSKNRISKELSQNLNTDNPDIEKLRLHHTLLKENINKLKVPLWSAEEAAIVEYLKLPNRLHTLTPTDKNKVIFEHGSPPSNQKNHMHIGKELDLVCYKSNTNYYLKSDAAIFELGSKFYFSNILRNNHYDQFSNPDFCKSFIVEGCGGDPSDPNSTYTLDHHVESGADMENRLHLTGSGAMTSFFAYHTKILYKAKNCL